VLGTTGTKTVTRDIAPHLKADGLTALLELNLESLTVAQVDMLRDAIQRVPGGDDPARTIGSLLP